MISFDWLLFGWVASSGDGAALVLIRGDTKDKRARMVFGVKFVSGDVAGYVEF